MPDMSDGHLTACTGRLICPAFWSLQPAYKRKFPRADGKPCTGESIQKKAATYSPALQAVPSA